MFVVGHQAGLRARGPSSLPRSGGKRRGRAQCRAQDGRRSVIILPGLGNNARDYDDMALELRNRDLLVHTVDVARIDWLRNAAGLLDGSYWRCTLKPRPVVDWYLNKLKEKIEAAKTETSGGPITFVAHSAGGWLGRTYLAEVESPADANVDCFVSLGSPHSPPPKDVQGAIDQTRGILTHVNAVSPGAFHDDVAYTTVCGTCVTGAALRSAEASLEEKICGQGYKQVCGSASVAGDGIVPRASAHLEGANQIDLDGVYHSPIGKGSREWYGDVIDAWLEHVYTTAE